MKKEISIVLLITAGFFCAKAQQKVTLDYYFNHETRTNSSGKAERYHYTWEDSTNSGFSLLGDIFRNNGLVTDSLAVAPTRNNLKGTAIYIIVDPDTKKETPNPNYIEPANVTEIADWVKAGGVLVLLANDTANVELDHFNNLAEQFGIQFEKRNRNMVVGKDFQTGKLIVPEKDPIFKTARVLYMKEICTIAVRPPAKASLTDKGDVIIATSRVGKGTVFALGDPWIYNEYITNKNIPGEFQNNLAAIDLVKWLKQQIPQNR